MRIILIISCLLFSGCSIFQQKVYVDKPIPYTHNPLGLTPPDSLILQPVEIKLVTPETGLPFFMMDSNSYKNFILNNKKIESYIRDSNGRIHACEEYYTRPLTE